MSDAAKAAITNIFVLMLENHSFDQMLGRSGLPGLKVAPTGASNSYDGKSYPLTSPAPWSMKTDPGHEFPDVLQQLCGAEAATAYLAKYDKGTRRDPHPVDGSLCHYPAIDLSDFLSSYATSTSDATGTPPSDHYGDIMGCFDTAAQLPVLYRLAQEFAVCDAWHSSGNMIGFLHVLLKAEIELAEKRGARAVADIVADFHRMTTHAHASAYVAKMKAMLDGLDTR